MLGLIIYYFLSFIFTCVGVVVLNWKNPKHFVIYFFVAVFGFVLWPYIVKRLFEDIDD